jgi:hypothetical protein
MPQTATIASLPVAFAMMKAMQAEGVEWGGDYRDAARQALVELLEGWMAERIDRRLERTAELAEADRRNGCYHRWLLTELGAIGLAVPRTRSFSALAVVRAYARRVHHIDRMILACFVLGLSTRKLASALLPILGQPVSPATVSAIGRQLDAAVAAFHRRFPAGSPPRAGAGRRGAAAQDRRRRAGKASAGGPRHPPRRQEGGNRLPLGRGRERRPVKTLPA